MRGSKRVSHISLSYYQAVHRDFYERGNESKFQLHGSRQETMSQLPSKNKRQIKNTERFAFKIVKLII